MMDFVWKQPPRDERPRQRAALRLRRADREHDRRAVQGAVRHRGVRRGLRADRDLRADHVAVRGAAARRARPACRTTSGSTSGWSTPRPTARSRSARSASSSSARCTRGPAATATTTCRRRPLEAWRNLWFHTGDALRRDEDGWYYFVDRYKDALRRRGENISSYEVEQAILGHPAVVECAVIGVPADRRPARTRCSPSSSPPGRSRPPRILAWCEGRIPAFAIPRYMRVVDALPKTPSEKVRKAALREAASPPTPMTGGRRRPLRRAARIRSRERDTV